MPKSGGNFYCNLCSEKVLDLTRENDLAVLQKFRNSKTPLCIHIQKERLPLLSRRTPKWRIFLIVLINYKAFVLQKVHAQQNDSLTKKQSGVNQNTKQIKGQIKDGYSGKPVKHPVIEVYKGDQLEQTATGDRHGRFAVSLKTSSDHTDTVSLIVSSKHHSSKKINGIPLFKKTTHLETTVASKRSKKNKVTIDQTFTGRYLD